MEIGAMYYDASDETITDKIKKFCSWYERSYGLLPTTCHVNKEIYNQNKEELEKINFIDVKADSSILPKGFWIGREEMTFQSYSSIRISGEE